MSNKSILVLMVICLIVVLSCQDAFAWFNGAHRHGVHYYRGGQVYRHNWFWFDAAVTVLAVGAVIESLPPRCETVMVGNVPYYYCNNVYYRQDPRGYIVVPAPAR